MRASGVKELLKEHRKRLKFAKDMGSPKEYRTVRNHVDLGPALFDVIEAIESNASLIFLPDVEEKLKALYQKLESLYGSTPAKG